MKKLTKTLLALSIAGIGLGVLLAADVLKAGDMVGWYMVLPAGAICFGAFLISHMLEGEFAQFDAEQGTHPASEVAAGKSADAQAPLGARHAH